MKKLSSEAVRRGHPDKLADQIADAILDAHLDQDPDARVALEVIVKSSQVIIAGEVTSLARVDDSEIANCILTDVGYKQRTVERLVTEQAGELAQLIEPTGKMVANDQSIVYGYATSETEEGLPLPHLLAQKLAVDLSDHCSFEFLRPDGKVLCVVAYPETGKPYLDQVVASVQHDVSVLEDEVRSHLKEYIGQEFNPWLREETVFHLNPSGSFLEGGPDVDTGVTGRKIIVDTYGCHIPHGGGSFSGKDPSKIDRVGAYAARYIAQNVLKEKGGAECFVQLTYAIGIVEPIAINVTVDGVFIAQEEIKGHYPLTMAEIIDTFDLKQPIYLNYAFGGHFGRNAPWDRLK